MRYLTHMKAGSGAAVTRCDGARRQALAVAAGALAAASVVAGCASTSTTADDAETPSSVPTSAAVTVPAGAVTRSPSGTVLHFGTPAVLPAGAFAPTGDLAMFTVTGITPAAEVPDSITKGGMPYFLYVTLTSLSRHPAPAPTVLGLAGSPDGRTPALTLSPPDGLAGCAKSEVPKTMRHGESYATCLVAVADPGQRLHTVIYWANTTTDRALDYQSAPVVWSADGRVPPTTSSAPTATG